MKVVKRINNSAALCVDDDGRNVIALGSGVGFTRVSEEVDLAKVTQTFYSVDERYVKLLNEIPLDIVEFATQIVQLAQGLLDYELTPGMPFVLADHIAFAVKRAREGIVIQMPLGFDVSQQYPVEYKLGRFTVNRINAQFGVTLPPNEAVGVAMSFINNMASFDSGSPDCRATAFEEMLARATDAVERDMDVKVDRNSFNYSRFATHLQYLYQRVLHDAAIESENADMYKILCDQYPLVARCVDDINRIFEQSMDHSLTDEERLYLMMHVNRIAIKAHDDNIDEKADG